MLESENAIKLQQYFMKQCTFCEKNNEKKKFFCIYCKTIQPVELDGDVSIFTIFNLEIKSEIEKNALDKIYSELILKVHPDKFFNDEDKNIAELNTAVINFGYNILSSQYKTCDYILHAIYKVDNLETDNEYILEMLDIYQKLHDIKKSSECSDLKIKLKQEHNTILERVKVNILSQELLKANRYMNRLKLINKAIHAIDNKERMLYNINNNE